MQMAPLKHTRVHIHMYIHIFLQVICVTYLVLGITNPSSTQQMLLFSSPTSTTHALLRPQPNVVHTDSLKIQQVNTAKQCTRVTHGSHTK